MVRGSYFGLWSTKVVLWIELLRSNSRLASLIILSDTVYTEGESMQNSLGDIWTSRMILALAYILYYVVATTYHKDKWSHKW